MYRYVELTLAHMCVCLLACVPDDLSVTNAKSDANLTAYFHTLTLRVLGVKKKRVREGAVGVERLTVKVMLDFSCCPSRLPPHHVSDKIYKLLLVSQTCQQTKSDQTDLGTDGQ